MLTKYNKLHWCKALHSALFYDKCLLKGSSIERLKNSIHQSMCAFWNFSKHSTMQDLVRHSTSETTFQNGSRTRQLEKYHGIAITQGIALTTDEVKQQQQLSWSQIRCRHLLYTAQQTLQTLALWLSCRQPGVRKAHPRGAPASTSRLSHLQPIISSIVTCSCHAPIIHRPTLWMGDPKPHNERQACQFDDPSEKRFILTGKP